MHLHDLCVCRCDYDYVVRRREVDDDECLRLIRYYNGNGGESKVVMIY